MNLSSKSCTLWKSCIEVVVVVALLVGAIGIARASEQEDNTEVRATWKTGAEIRFSLDDDGDINLDCPIDVRMDGQVVIEAGDLTLQADRLSYSHKGNSLVLESDKPNGARLSWRWLGERSIFRVVGRRITFRPSDKRVTVEGEGELRVESAHLQP